MNPQLKKAKRWFGRAAILVALIAILIATLPKFPTNWSPSSLFDSSANPPIVWSFNLQGGEWSGDITIPRGHSGAGSNYRIDVDVPVKVCFIDDPGCVKPYTVYPAGYQKPTWFGKGILRESFKLLSPVDTTVLVTIQER